MPTDSETEAGFYPGTTALEGQVSIFLLAFRHAVSYDGVDDWLGRVERLGWCVHPYLPAAPEPFRTECEGRIFAPQQVLTPTALTTIFGHTWGTGGRRDWAADRRLLRDRLSPRHGRARHVENLLLTRDPERCRWIGRCLQASPPPTTDALVFTIEWVDVWLFDDNSGLLAFKARLEEVRPTPGAARSPTLTDLGGFHRYLRDWRDRDVKVVPASGQGPERRFWEDLVCGEWLGGETPGGHLLMGNGTRPQDRFDGFSHYCKLLTGVQLGEVGDGEEAFAWSSPLADPLAEYPYRRHFGELRTGEWGNALAAFQAAAIAGYPTYRDLFLIELATTSDEGAAGGHGGRRGWQYSNEYLRRLLETDGIEIWEYWSGLAVRDVCAFVSWSREMPLIRGGQLEGRYYPLYAHAYHLRFELDDIGAHCVDHDLVDNRRLRIQLRRFETFRTRYWFKEVTRDSQGVEVFTRMRRGLEVDALFASVSEEVREVGEYLEGRAERGRQLLVTLLIAAAYPLYVWFKDASGNTWIGPLLERYTQFNSMYPWWALGAAVLMILGLFLVLRLVAVWFRSAGGISGWLQRVYGWLDHNRPW